VAGERDFQQRVQNIAGRVEELEAIADPAVRAAARGLVQLLMELHGFGLERMLEIIFQSKEVGPRVIDELGADPQVSGLLILHGLHPADLQTRIERKLDEVRSRLFKMGAEVNLVSVHEGDVRVRVSLDRHTCGSTTQAVRSAVEDAIYEAAPDLTSLVVEGLDAPAASGFVAMEALARSSAPAAHREGMRLHGEGMD